ncbi:condensin complex subunit 2 isoform X2 [Plodia interpunctella]|uniref:condensin complex subunit 2 isoform X2 n=1 Tax=Plodia interpunctella TaxID=58824 RepID=UPI002368C839|nr:condensin complex subunit 2 isoform X2 [Plodia interpunctella]
MIETSISSTPGLTRLSLGGSSSSSIRRRSLIPKIKSRDEQDRNDDDAERSSLLASERVVATSTPTTSSPRRGRDTMSTSPQKEHFQGCLKLYAENKINKDNAWNLQLIDFMTTMLRRHDSRMDNLQTASTVVDASARIYSFRVDAVHYDVLKMAGGLSKAAQTKRGKKDDDDAVAEEATEGAAPAKARSKKKRSKGAVAANPEVFNGDFDANDYIDPFFERLAATQGDVTSSNRAFNATLPIHDTTLALILRTDDKFLEPIKENIPEHINLKASITLSAKLLPTFAEGDHICEPFTGFSITNWDPDTEDTNTRVNNWVEDNRLNLSQQALAFDVNADVEPIPQEEPNNDLFDDEPLGGIESEEEAEAALAACAVKAPQAAVARLTDMRPHTATDTRLEYSYCGAIVTAWAGPQHWRLRNNTASRQSERTQSTGRLTVEGKKPARTKRQLDFLGAGLAFDSRAEPSGDYEPTQPAKIMISRKTLATGHTWNEANFKTPIDRGLDESHFRKLFIRRNVMLLRKRDLEASRKASQPPPEPLTVEETKDYDYNNENDADYCSNNMQEGDSWGPEDGGAAPLHARDGLLGDMLEPPTKVAKIFIPYAMRAKKVDMKQLKHCTWKMLTEKTPEGAKEEVSETSFFTVYSRLPNKLSSNMRESLSVPLALLSVLHLANERGLVLEKRDDLNDIGILGLIK